MADNGGSTAVTEGGGGGGGQQQAQQQPQQGGGVAGFLYRLMLMWTFYNLFFKGSSKPADPALLSGNLFSPGQSIDAYVFLSENATFHAFLDNATLLWSQSNIVYGSSADMPLLANFNITPSLSVQQNGSLYAHVCVTKHGVSPDELSATYEPTGAFCRSKLLTRYRLKAHTPFRKHLITSMSDEEEQRQKDLADFEKSNPVIVSHWYPNLTIHLVDDQTVFNRNAIPPQLKDALVFEEVTKKYFPVVYFNDFWMLKEHLSPINETVTELPLYLEFDLIAFWKWQLMSQMDTSFRTQNEWGQMNEQEADNIKRTLTETSPYLLALTVAVSLLHSVFDFLAFKNDVVFWKQRRSMKGLSVKTIFTNIFFQVIIFLYLLDNETSWLILLSSGVGLVIEVWKVKKAVNFSTEGEKIFGIFPRLSYTHKASYKKSKTKEYDDLAFRYLSWLLFPTLVGYSVYSLVYETHKSWYSWVIASMVGAVYTFGFITMTPQLFINYKLKSVAHLPWKMMTYKVLNTFIDDIFAFIIKMPLMHRLACFRDDIIFFIFLYQRWIYPVDPNRANEFEGGDDLEDEDEGDGAQQEAIGDQAAASSASKQDEPEAPQSSKTAAAAAATDGGLKRRNKKQASRADLLADKDSSVSSSSSSSSTATATATATTTSAASQTPQSAPDASLSEGEATSDDTDAAGEDYVLLKTKKKN